MRPNAGTSITQANQHAARTAAQGARSSAPPVLSGSVEVPPSASRVEANGQDAAKTKPCYCENRDCNCTPSVVAAIERITEPDSDWPVMPFVTPLTYSDALTLVDEAMGHGTIPVIVLRDRLAHLLMTVDTESRAQSALFDGLEAVISDVEGRK